MLGAPGTVRIVASYTVLGRPAHMVFHFTVPELHIPTQEDCFALASNYVSWERGLFGIVLGYSSSRSADSVLRQTTAYSLDLRGARPRTDDFAAVFGLVPGHLRVTLPTSLAPVIVWDILDPTGRERGRTYAVGYCADQLGTSDLMRLSSTDRTAVAQQFENLRQFMADNGGQMVHLRGGRLAAEAGRLLTFPIVGVVECREHLGSQRRRTPIPR